MAPCRAARLVLPHKSAAGETVGGGGGGGGGREGVWGGGGRRKGGGLTLCTQGLSLIPRPLVVRSVPRPAAVVER